MAQVWGISCGLLSALSVALMSSLIHSLSQNYNAFELTVIRTAWIAILLLPFVYREIGKFFQKNNRALWSRSLFGSIALILNFMSFQILPVSHASFLIAANTTVLVTLAQHFFLKKPLTKLKIRGTMLVLFGLAMFYGFKWPDLNSLQLMLPIAGGTFTAIAFISLKMIAGKQPNTHILFSLSVVSLIIASFFEVKWQHVISSWNSTDLLLLVILSFLTQYFLNISYVHLDANLAAVCSQTVVVWAFMIDLLSGTMAATIQNVLAIVCVLLGVYWCSSQKTDQKPSYINPAHRHPERSNGSHVPTP